MRRRRGRRRVAETAAPKAAIEMGVKRLEKVGGRRYGIAEKAEILVFVKVGG